ncbi:MAG: hypothetical protein FWB72_04530 [Firmicutes bacterium]|nr:hypothetical protein [Bacillota bacterium]
MKKQKRQNETKNLVLPTEGNEMEKQQMQNLDGGSRDFALQILALGTLVGGFAGGLMITGAQQQTPGVDYGAKLERYRAKLDGKSDTINSYRQQLSDVHYTVAGTNAALHSALTTAYGMPSGVGAGEIGDGNSFFENDADGNPFLTGNPDHHWMEPFTGDMLEQPEPEQMAEDRSTLEIAQENREMADTLIANLNSAQDNSAENQERINELGEKIDGLNTQIDGLENDVYNLNTDLNSANQTLETYRETLQGYRDNYAIANQTIAALNAQVYGYQEEITYLTYQLEQSGLLVESLEQQINDLRAGANIADAEVRRELQQAISERDVAQARAEGLQNQLGQVQAAHDGVVQELASQVALTATLQQALVNANHIEALGLIGLNGGDIELSGAGDLDALMARLMPHAFTAFDMRAEQRVGGSDTARQMPGVELTQSSFTITAQSGNLSQMLVNDFGLNINRQIQGGSQQGVHMMDLEGRNAINGLRTNPRGGAPISQPVSSITVTNNSDVWGARYRGGGNVEINAQLFTSLLGRSVHPDSHDVTRADVARWLGITNQVGRP